MTAIPMAEQDQVEHMLARQFYLHFCEHRKSSPNKAPHVPAWAQAYAEIAVAHLGYDQSALDTLMRDYK